MRRRLFPGLALACVVLLTLAACGDGPAAVAGQIVSSPTPALVYPTVEAQTAAPTSPPPVPTTPRPTATWVPLITPSPTPGEKLPTRADVPRIAVAEARALADAGEAVFVDVRGDPAYTVAHIAGAISLPAGDVARRIHELPAGKLPIFYCA